jgi:hypothetical protein
MIVLTYSTAVGVSVSIESPLPPSVYAPLMNHENP